VGLLVAVNSVFAALTYRQYQHMLEYCAGFDRDGLECLGADGSRVWQLWKAIGLEVAAWTVFEVVALAVLVTALRREQGGGAT
jgi:hypothetical protein